ncbi:hypothetical protein [Streptomyces sp. JB150]|uniref:hypothetical protein n=1 Tax=Streptomyces sp. JB150 TaxID=2714844 RepID=UPI00140D308F|nr:hypothetical protein [Streptomyces sp. JB150]QIJ61853.1 hypothetical protein G7Z13_07240 [Streptomyces sp. JB150]
MHAYDAPRRPSYSSVPPPPRSAQDQTGPSATPIYDKLYSEYVKSFRTLPGDRSGEEKLGFTAFGTIPYGAGSFGSSYTSYSAYSVGAQSARHGGGQQQPQWQRVGQIPAALPPGRRGTR